MPFAKGHKPMGGRPKGVKNASTIDKEKALEYIKERVTAELEPIMDKAIEQAKAGDTQTRKDLMDRAFGKPKETIDLHDRVEFLNFPKDDAASHP